jgi:hypothetical protein
MRNLWLVLIFLLPAFACSVMQPESPPEAVPVTVQAAVILPTEFPPAATQPLPTDETAAPTPTRTKNTPGPLDDSSPVQPVRLIFIHHSSGENWLADENGGLGLALMRNQYFVSDTNYDWGPTDPLLGGSIGSYTDTGNWWNWFLGPSHAEILAALYAEGEQHAAYSRLENNPGGENQIILFKSCFPNSAMEGSPQDLPVIGENPLRGQDSGSGNQTVANAKGIYRDLLTYFSAHPEKLFVVITAPPLLASETSPVQAANARAFNRWLVQDWLKEYPLANVAVFDFYNVLTSNGGGPDRNDAGSARGNHHRYLHGQIEYITDQGGNASAYAQDGDSHPTAAGNQKATQEFLPILNYFYHRWIASSS